MKPLKIALISVLLMTLVYSCHSKEDVKQYAAVENYPEQVLISQIVIKSEAKPKMDYLRSYNERERKTIGFFVPAFEKYKADEYFTIFDREFYRVIEI
jgi:hypothetical protein